MNIYMFKSEGKSELRAFAGDPEGSRLPDQFRPWHAVGVITTGRALPHNFSRTTIEKAIEADGFQLWRVKPAIKPAIKPVATAAP
jgi:hypothetical protein